MSSAWLRGAVCAVCVCYCGEIVFRGAVVLEGVRCEGVGGGRSPRGGGALRY